MLLLSSIVIITKLPNSGHFFDVVTLTSTDFMLKNGPIKVQVKAFFPKCNIPKYVFI